MIVGEKLGGWVLLEKLENPKKYYAKHGKYRQKYDVWVARCECGREGKIYSTNVSHIRESGSGCGVCATKKRRKHDMSKSSTYKIWGSMIQRCINPHEISYRYYGGMGAKVCSRWMADFRNFLKDMGERPSGMCLSRKDVGAKYEPSNCYWASKLEVAQKRRPRAEQIARMKEYSEHGKYTT